MPNQVRFKNDKLPEVHEERIRYLYRFQEVLRLVHNKKGKDFREGKISEEEFRNFQADWFKKRNTLISREICKCRENLPQDFNKINYDNDKWINPYKAGKKDTTIIVHIDDIEEE